MPLIRRLSVHGIYQPPTYTVNSKRFGTQRLNRVTLQQREDYFVFNTTSTLYDGSGSFVRGVMLCQSVKMRNRLKMDRISRLENSDQR
jgi:hypothetical protein